MFSLYLASHYERRLELCGYRALLQKRGYRITSRWLDGEQDIEKWKAGVYGRWDLEDINNAHFLVAFTDHEPHMRGGLHTEIGYALALDANRVFVVGPRTNVFHQLLPDGRVFEEYKEFFSYLDKIHESWKKRPRMFPVLRPSLPVSMYEMYLNGREIVDDDDNSDRPWWNHGRSHPFTVRKFADNSGIVDGKST